MIEAQIKKNFLQENDFLKLYHILFSHNFTWHYSPSNSEGDNESYFFHFFYDQNAPCSRFYPEIIPLLNTLEPLSLIAIKANMYINKGKNCIGAWHRDEYGNNKLNHNTAIFYVNDNNGYTQFENDKIKCERNKLLIFPATLKHRSVSQTDTDRKILLNINYF